MKASSPQQQSRLTVSLPAFQVHFIADRAKSTGKAKSQVIQEALRLLESQTLDEELKQGALANAEQDHEIAEEERVTFWNLSS